MRPFRSDTSSNSRSGRHKLAHLTGFSDYESLDRVQQEWFAFAQAQDKDYKNWMEAWEAFSAQQGKGA